MGPSAGISQASREGLGLVDRKQQLGVTSIWVQGAHNQALSAKWACSSLPPRASVQLYFLPRKGGLGREPEWPVALGALKEKGACRRKHCL